MQHDYNDSQIEELEELTSVVQSPQRPPAELELDFPIVLNVSGSLSLGISVYHLDDLYQLFLK